ncbi:tyrosine-type recombinase/integrase [Stenotrophomonas hibiscicola]|uniref:tyrosine-type recombinase/integrase n=1 Tax=Stenotrophomonas hibiscicola TaxID=86189 RepID=UPI0009AC8A8E|nr:integrase arm-type DNA-binding domain-containing protein [[Pseudomonas] hibiscicola]
MKLTVPFIGKATPGRHGDGGGLYLLVKLDGRKTWVFRYRDRTTGKQRDKGLGPYPDVKLAEARELAANCRSQLRQDIDPIAFKRDARERAKAEQGRMMTFGECATRFIAANRPSWRNAKHADQWQSTIETYCSAILKLPVSEVDTNHVYRALYEIWERKTETATRLRGRIERVLDWASVNKLRSGDNPARWKGNLQHLLPAPEPLKNVEHRPALPYSEVPGFMKKLEQRRELSALALQLQVLTATRPGEATGAKWEEIDWQAKLWTVPSSRTKSKKAHEVPLSEEAIALLKRVPNCGKPHIFPGRANRPIVTASSLKVLRGIPGAEEATCHGFRSSFRDWAADKTNHERDIIEMSLAHKVAGKVEAAYLRTKMLEKRAALMADWGNYCLAITGD